ncbi:hypothetical protein D3H35_04240 [Cohnella faecalis]|uniref:Uncharacterized protein n=1 Tax=Cohnella faecalis TaxID=2315694 RepID=A0A398CQE7_9BACL|nr:hypothetical protein D3H35_04240 [Cohnella faecalis]
MTTIRLAIVTFHPFAVPGKYKKLPSDKGRKLSIRGTTFIDDASLPRGRPLLLPVTAGAVRLVAGRSGSGGRGHGKFSQPVGICSLVMPGSALFPVEAFRSVAPRCRGAN